MDTKSVKTIAVFELLTALGIVLFWIGFFTIGLAPANPPQCYFAYEHSFPLPDILLAIALFFASMGLIKAKPWGRSLSLVCAGSLLFLGILDFSFNIQNGVYAVSTLDLISNAFINIWCVIFGLVVFLKFRQPA